MRIAMVCMGNICRSPMAEHIFRAKAAAAGLEIEVESAGTGGWHVGDPADSRAVQTLRKHGYTSEHRAQQFSREWFDRFELILVMDAENLRNVLSQGRNESDRAKVRLLRSYDPVAEIGAEVPDPYYSELSAYEEVRVMVEAACDGLIKAIAEGRR